MNPSSPSSPTPGNTSSRRDTRPRQYGVGILILVLGELLIGNELARAGSPYPAGWLGAHVAVALALIALSAYVLVVALRLPSRAVQAIAGITVVSALGATVAGTLFLVAGGSDSSLFTMEFLGSIAFVGAFLLMVWGSVSVPDPTTAKG